MFAITERLLLRPGWPEDAPALARAIGDRRVARNLARVPWPYRLADADEHLARPIDPLRPDFLILLRGSATLVGGVGLQGDVLPELGCWIAPAFRGRGLAGEAARAVVAMADASLRLPRLVASHALDDPASGRMLVRLGFVPGGTARLHSAARGCDMEVRLFARERGGAQIGRAALAA